MKPINRRSAIKRTAAEVGELAFKPGTSLAQDANDGRMVHSHLPAVRLNGVANPVVQLIADATGEIHDTIHSNSTSA